MVQFAEIPYAPIFFQRTQEMRAIAELSSGEKGSMFPIFRVRPWLNSKYLEKSIETLQKAMGGLPFACDVDEWWQSSGKERDATLHFQELRADQSGRTWYEFVRQFDEAVPCLRLGGPIEEILETITTPWLVERGFGIVLTEKNIQYAHKIPRILSAINHSNFFVLVDSGWSREPLTNLAATNSAVSNILNARDTTALFVSCSTFPKQFSQFGIGDSVALDEITFFNSIRSFAQQNFNRANVGYSDWATTRPPSDIKGGGGWIPRIDVPRVRDVVIYRSRIDESLGEDVKDACIRLARSVVADPNWPSPPPSWGHYLVDVTAAESDFGVYSAQRNTATRINMHLFNRLSELTGHGTDGYEEPFDG